MPCLDFSGKTTKEIGLSGDLSRNHINEQYMATTQFKHRIAHGMLTMSISCSLSTQFADASPVPCVSYGYDTIRFLKPVYINDTLNITYTIGLVSSAPLGGFLPEFMVLDLPYLFRDSAHLYKVIDGDLGRDLFKMLESQRIIGLSFMDNGFRNIASNGKAVTKPSDLEGIKIRVMENEVHTTAFQRLGAIPVPMASGEVYTGLQQGTINASENSICSIYSIKYQEIAKEISLTRHFAGAAPMIMSKAKYDSLKPEYQKILMEAAKEACELQRKEVARQEVVLIEEMKKLGCTFHDVDPVPFREIFLGVYPEFEHIIPQEFVKRVLETK